MPLDTLPIHLPPFPNPIRAPRRDVPPHPLILQGNWDDIKSLLTQVSFSNPTSNLANHMLNGDACTVLTPMAMHPRNAVATPCASIPTTVTSTLWWVGWESLNDFWVYGIQAERWRIVSHNTALEKSGLGRRGQQRRIVRNFIGIIRGGRMRASGVYCRLIRQ